MNAFLAQIRRHLAPLEQQFRARFGQDMVLTDRVKILVTVAAGVLIVAALFGLHRYVGGIQNKYTSAQTNLTRLQAQITTDVWPGRKEQSQILRALLEDRFWTAQTPGLADAGFERWLRDHLARYQMVPLQQIQVRRVPASRPGAPGFESLADLQRMSAKILLPFNGDGLTDFLRDVAESEKTIIVDHMNVRAGRNARIEIDISAFYRAREKS